MNKILASALIACSACSNASDKIIPAALGNIIIPKSSQAQPLDEHRRAHTNVMLYQPKHRPRQKVLPQGEDYFYFGGETPASIACIYGVTTDTSSTSGCPKDLPSLITSGGGGTIVIVDAYQDDNILSDCNTFSAALGVPSCNGKVFVHSMGGVDEDSGWSLEQDLDVQWAHAMAPDATIVLVQAVSNSHDDLYAAVQYANTLLHDGGTVGGHVVPAAPGYISMSWSSAEYPSELSDDQTYFHNYNTYAAAAGDSYGPTQYPAASPYVMAAGGTSIIRDNTVNAAFIGERGWDMNGSTMGGLSLYESIPRYQDEFYSPANIVGYSRGIPDLSLDSDPVTGVNVYSTANEGWNIVGGTSVAAPTLTGIINHAQQTVAPPLLPSARPKIAAPFISNGQVPTQDLLSCMYAESYSTTIVPQYFNDITVGTNGFPALVGYDLLTGIGTPNTDTAFTGEHCTVG